MRAVASPADTHGQPRALLADQVYVALRQELQNFALIPGDRFSEADVAQRLGVSRTPVREALFRLRNEGRLDVESKSGWTVRPIDFDRLEQLYELRVVIEAACVSRLCALAETPPAMNGLKALWLVPAAERWVDQAAVGEADEQFHSTLVAAAGNAEMTRVHRDVTDHIRIVRRLDFTRSDRIEATYIEHGKILRAVMQRKTDAALLLLRSHIEQSKAEVRKITLHALFEARARAKPATRGR
ncbi:MAG: GntR family transcriptional regulator [Rubrivivax sp.]|nr:GntR family transcriptional regulator [Rubrivivax sp.]